MKYSSVPLEQLQEDLFIPPWVRKHIASLREADPTTSA